jgi:hypothetical protein
LVERGVQQVGAQPALGAADDSGEGGAPGRVQQGGPEQQAGEQPDQPGGGLVGQLSGDDGGERLGRGGDTGHDDGGGGGGLGQPSPGQPCCAHVPPPPARPGDRDR